MIKNFLLATIAACLIILIVILVKNPQFLNEVEEFKKSAGPTSDSTTEIDSFNTKINDHLKEIEVELKKDLPKFHGVAEAVVDIDSPDFKKILGNQKIRILKTPDSEYKLSLQIFDLPDTEETGGFIFQYSLIELKSKNKIAEISKKVDWQNPNPNPTQKTPAISPPNPSKKVRKIKPNAALCILKTMR